MKNQTRLSSAMPLLLEVSYVETVVEHPFPLNYILKQWYLGSDFYYSVKIGIVQYVRVSITCKVCFISTI